MTNLNVPMTAQMSTQTTVRITQTKAGHNSRETTKTLSHLSTRVYTPSIVTMAVSLTVYEIFNVKASMRDLENWIRGCSRSLKMSPFDRP